jgi:hypothetical protein
MLSAFFLLAGQSTDFQMETGHKNPSGGAGGISAKRGRNEHLYLKGFKAFFVSCSLDGFILPESCVQILTER